MSDPRSLLRNAPYLLLMSGKTTQIMGEGIGMFAVPLVAFGLTGSVVTAGVMSARRAACSRPCPPESWPTASTAAACCSVPR
jgi:hypothetical protein